MNERSECDIVGLGRNIHKKRVEHGISQEQLAEMLDISRQSVSKWENRLTEPSKKNLNMLAKILGCQLSEMLETKENNIDNNLLVLLGIYWSCEDEQGIKNFFKEMPFDVYDE